MKERAEKKRLEHASGPKFDQAYMDHMVKDHNNDVNEFRKESQNGKDSAVKDFALKTLPKLEEHLKLAQEVQGKVKSATNEGAPPASETAKDSSKPKY
jgi:putative membrane protein